MSSSTRSTRPAIDSLEAIIEAGFGPSDELSENVSWAYYYDGAIVVSDERLLLARYRSDEVTVSLHTMSGVVIEELRFSAPDDEMTAVMADALAAVAEAWSK